VKKNIVKKILAALVLASSFSTAALVTDCKDLHIGRIWVEKGAGLKGVVHLNNRDDSAGSYWNYFTGWSTEDRKEALSILLAAKAANHRVNVVTENTDGCGLQDNYTVAKSIYLATNP
jgi:hypothetical protein